MAKRNFHSLTVMIMQLKMTIMKVKVEKDVKVERLAKVEKRVKVENLVNNSVVSKYKMSNNPQKKLICFLFVSKSYK